MAKEYLRMADVFRDVVQPERFNYAMANPKATYAAHAINSHDELVAEVERLRGELSAVGSVLNEVDRVISERIKNGAYDMDDISAEVSQVIERINRDDY
jgi:hypothetical protein